jgi:hypothetical protein
MQSALRLIAAVSLFTIAAYGLTAGPARAGGRAHFEWKGRHAPDAQAATAPRDSLAIIVNRTNPVDNLSFTELLYEMREQDFHAHFLRAKFTGELPEEPRLLDTTSRVINFVFLQPGALAYVRADETTPSIKVVRLDGLTPGDPDYKLTF